MNVKVISRRYPTDRSIIFIPTENDLRVIKEIEEDPEKEKEHPEFLEPIHKIKSNSGLFSKIN